jgi:hypothetical protein
MDVRRNYSTGTGSLSVAQDELSKRDLLFGSSHNMNSPAFYPAPQLEDDREPYIVTRLSMVLECYTKLGH